MENVTEPVGAGPAPPLPTVTESVAAVPGETPTPDGELLLDCAAVRQEGKEIGPAKSSSAEVDECAGRGCGWKEVEHPAKGRPARAMAANTKEFCAPGA